MKTGKATGYDNISKEMIEVYVNRQTSREM